MCNSARFCTSAGQSEFGSAELCGCFCELCRDPGDPGAFGGEVETNGFTAGDHGFEDFLEDGDFTGVCICCVKRILDSFEDAFDIWSRDDARKFREIESLERNRLEANKSRRHQDLLRTAEVDLDKVVTFSVGAIEYAFEIGRCEVEVLSVESLSDASAAVRESVRAKTARRFHE